MFVMVGLKFDPVDVRYDPQQIRVDMNVGVIFTKECLSSKIPIPNGKYHN